MKVVNQKKRPHYMPASVSFCRIRRARPKAANPKPVRNCGTNSSKQCRLRLSIQFGEASRVLHLVQTVNIPFQESGGCFQPITPNSGLHRFDTQSRAFQKSCVLFSDLSFRSSKETDFLLGGTKHQDQFAARGDLR